MKWRRAWGHAQAGSCRSRVRLPPDLRLSDKAAGRPANPRWAQICHGSGTAARLRRPEGRRAVILLRGAADSFKPLNCRAGNNPKNVRGSSTHASDLRIACAGKLVSADHEPFAGYLDRVGNRPAFVRATKIDAGGGSVKSERDAAKGGAFDQCARQNARMVRATPFAPARYS
jgi:hypothetical protein